MILGTILALMLAAAVFAVLWPLSRQPRDDVADTDLAVYRDQLAEIERDKAAGTIAPPEAEAARIEVSRRLIAAAEARESVAADDAVSRTFRRRAAAVAALVLIPVMATLLYLRFGSPQLPGQPLAARMNAPQLQDRSIETLIARVEAHLAQNPNDGKGWEVIAPVYLRLNRIDDAIRAQRNVLSLLGESAPRRADLGEALTIQANGVVTADAKQEFERAAKLDENDPRAQFYLGLAAEQDGRAKDAAEIWRALIAKAPADAPWLPMVREALERVGGEGPAAPAVPPAPRGPSAADVAAANQMTPAERNEMIRGMVDRLASRLAQDGSDVEGWLRLMRAYVVLGDRDKARTAAEDARRALKDAPDLLRRIDEGAKAIGLDG